MLTAPLHLPVIGGRSVTPCPHEPGHWRWLSLFGWHDCTLREDTEINAARGDHA